MYQSDSTTAAMPPVGSTDSTALHATASRRIVEDRIVVWLLRLATVFAASVVLLVIVFVVRGALPLLQHSGLSWLTSTQWDTDLQTAYDTGTWTFGMLPLLVGTTVTTVGSLLLAGIIGTGAAIFLAELAPERVRQPVEAFVRLLSGIPSVVFGLVGLTVIVPWIFSTFVTDAIALKYTDIPLDGSGYAAAIGVLTFMIMPFYVTVATDSLRAIPRSYREGGLALGMSRWRTITRVVLPAAVPGLIAGLVLAAARAVGEAIAVSMVGGAIAYIPTLRDGLIVLLSPTRTMASAIVENGETMNVAQIQAALFMLASMLLLISLSLSVCARLAFAWFQRRMGLVSDRAV